MYHDYKTVRYLDETINIYALNTQHSSQCFLHLFVVRIIIIFIVCDRNRHYLKYVYIHDDYVPREKFLIRNFVDYVFFIFSTTHELTALRCSINIIIRVYLQRLFLFLFEKVPQNTRPTCVPNVFIIS